MLKMLIAIGALFELIVIIANVGTSVVPFSIQSGRTKRAPWAT